MPARLTGAPHVLMTTDTVGGVWTYALDLAAGLVGAGARVTLAALGPQPGEDQRRQAAGMPGLALRCVAGPLDWTASHIGELAAPARALAALARELAVDLVHLNSPALAALTAFDAPVLGACHSCSASWWAAVRGGPLPEDLVWRRNLLAQGYAACDALLAPTTAFATVTSALYGITPEVVWNGRRPEDGASAPAEREPVALTAGRLWDESKDVATLDRAAALTRHPLVALGPLAGPNGGRAAFEHLITPGRLGTDEVADRMARAAVFVSSAVYEPFGLAVLEAVQAGAALVLSDIATFRELWDGAAEFVAPRDAGGFAAAIDRMLQDETLRAARASEARIRATRYSVEAMTDGVLAIYARLSPSFGQARVAA